MENFNGIDYLICVVFILSMVAGFARGLVKEVISVVTWVLAALIATKFASPLAAAFAGSSSAAVQSAFGSGAAGATAAQSLSVISIVVSFIVLFMGTLLIGALVGYMMGSIVSSTGLGFLNRIFGIAFGGMRGYLMTVVLIFVAQLTPIVNYPAWAQSQLVPEFQPAVQWFSSLASPEIQALQAQALAVIQSVKGQLPNPSSVLQSFSK